MAHNFVMEKPKWAFLIQKKIVWGSLIGMDQRKSSIAISIGKLLRDDKETIIGKLSGSKHKMTREGKSSKFCRSH